MKNDLKDKVAVVTGAATGIGYAISENFLREGAKVILLDINSEQGEESTRILNSKYSDKATFIQCDVTRDLDKVYESIFSLFDKVDVLVNNAGINDETSARRTMEVNALAVIEWSVKFYQRMRVDKGGAGGTIMNVSSVYGYMVDPFMLYYKASKFAVFGFSKSLGHQHNYQRSGVRVVVMCPGLTNTQLAANPNMWEEHVEDLRKYFDESPRQTPDFVGKAVVDIYKNAASGTAWVIDASEPAKEIQQNVNVISDLGIVKDSV